MEYYFAHSISYDDVYDLKCLYYNSRLELKIIMERVKDLNKIIIINKTR